MRTISVAIILLFFAAACAGTPDTVEQQDDLTTSANDALRTMKARDPGLNRVLGNSKGYVVFPDIGKGGVLVGGAHGTGVVYQDGSVVGFAELNQASIGA